MKLITKENLNLSVGNTFIECDQAIFYADYLNDSEKRVYFELKNKLKLSIKNNYVTGNGEYYIFYAQDELADRLGYSKRTVHSAFKKLSATDKGYSPLIKLDRETTNTYRILFYEVDNGEYGTYTKRGYEVNNASSESYVKNEVPAQDKVSIEREVVEPTVFDSATPIDVLVEQASYQVEVEQAMFDYANAKFSHGDAKFACGDETFATRKKESKTRNTKKDNNNLSIYQYSKEQKEEMEMKSQTYHNNINYIKDQISYYDLIHEYPDTAILDEFVLCATEMITDNATKIQGDLKPVSIIESVLARLDMFKMQEVIERFSNNVNKIHNISGYMKTMLFDVCRNGSATMLNTVRYNSYGV